MPLPVTLPVRLLPSVASKRQGVMTQMPAKTAYQLALPWRQWNNSGWETNWCA